MITFSEVKDWLVTQGIDRVAQSDAVYVKFTVEGIEVQSYTRGYRGQKLPTKTSQFFPYDPEEDPDE